MMPVNEWDAWEIPSEVETDDPDDWREFCDDENISDQGGRVVDLLVGM